MVTVRCRQCNDERKVAKDTGALCRKCASTNRRLSDYSDEGYYNKCMDCSIEWHTKHRSNATWCKSCAAKQNGRSIDHTLYDRDHEGKYSATCGDCGDIRYVTRRPSLAKTNLCGTCSRRAIGKMSNNLSKPKKKKVVVKKSTKKKPSKAAIEKARAINKEHRDNAYAPKDIPKKLSEEQERHLIEEFYKSNKVVCVEAEIPYGTTDVCRFDNA